MPKVKVGLRKMTVPNKIQLARQVVHAMTSNANFPAPSPALASVSTAAVALEAAYHTAQTARQSAKAKTASQKTADAALERLLTQLANYVEHTSGGDPAKIQSSGYGVRSPNQPVGSLAAPQNLKAKEGANQGEIELKWKNVRGASSYVIQLATILNGDASWLLAGASTKSKARIPALPSGARMWFRVAAVGAAGQGAFSDAAEKIVP